MFCHCLYLQCQDKLKCQNVGLATDAEGLYDSGNIEENGGRGMEWGWREEERKGRIVIVSGRITISIKNSIFLKKHEMLTMVAVKHL